MYDAIIVGAGSAGCVLAHRLSADPRKKILLLEAGGRCDDFMVRMPKGIARLVSDPQHAWHFPVSQPRAPDMPASEVWVRGKGLGGSSAINGMIYVRGHPQDYEDWAKDAGSDWGWPAMKAAFKAIEDHELGASESRGAGGPLHISTGKFRYPIAEAMIRAGEAMGLRRKEDLNDEDQEGVGYYPHTIKDGKRVSAATAFLQPARRRPNLHIVDGVIADRVIVENRRAVGIEGRRGGVHTEYRCSGEIILSAGTLGSPLLLQRSGIGPAAMLQARGIAVIAESPDVGARLREHLGATLPYRLKGAAGLNRRFYGLGLMQSLAQYLAFGTGPMATGPFEVGAFVRTGPHAARPDAQLYLSAMTFARGDDNFPVPLNDVERAPGLTIYGQLLRLESEGSILVGGPDPDAPPLITPNWLSAEPDHRAAIAMVRYMRRYMQQPALAPFVGEEHFPGEGCSSDAAILDFVRRFGLCGLHAVGTCRMGRDNAAVVDERLRVRGVDGLRVADCAAMPGLVTGNTSGPAMALGWRAADLILADWRR